MFSQATFFLFQQLTGEGAVLGLGARGLRRGVVAGPALAVLRAEVRRARKAGRNALLEAGAVQPTVARVVVHNRATLLLLFLFFF